MRDGPEDQTLSLDCLTTTEKLGSLDHLPRSTVHPKMQSVQYCLDEDLSYQEATKTVLEHEMVLIQQIFNEPVLC